MIFYFSGTGNSLAAAKAICQAGEMLIPIADAIQKGEYCYTPSPEETVGFVFPVYFYGLPDAVRRFANQVRFASKPDYVYAVITCGGSIGGAGNLLKQALASGGSTLRAVYTVKMPDNYVLLYDVPTEEKEKAVLASAEKRLAEVRDSIALRRFTGAEASAAAKLKTAAIYPWYDRTRKTDKFYADESCTGCGTCARRCPDGAIEMQSGKPVWVKPSCEHCLACLRCNAVQFGKRTVGRRRYTHPALRRK